MIRSRHLVAGSSLLLFLLAIPDPSAASCRMPGGFAIFQCGDRGYFDPPPEGAGAVTALFWQIGFGNALINSGIGFSGVGIAPMGVFSGVDNGLLRVPVVEARSALGDPNVPEGALCLGPVNWGNIDVDGCCDNARDPNMQGAMDGFLNPEFNPLFLRKKGAFIPAPDRAQDYPMAVLLREESARWFAVAAASASARSGLEDLRPGAFSFGAISEGKPSAITGAGNVIPWQKVPEIRLEVKGPAPKMEGEGDGEGAQARWHLRATWDPATVPTDGVHHPSEGYGIDNPGRGVGAADMGPLVWYQVQTVRLTPGYISEEGLPIREVLPWETAARVSGTEAEIDLEEDACARVMVSFGKMPRTATITIAECALGHCGDVGFGVAGSALCVQGPLLRDLAAGKKIAR